jgi:hypothetical protein
VVRRLQPALAQSSDAVPPYQPAVRLLDAPGWAVAVEAATRRAHPSRRARLSGATFWRATQHMSGASFLTAPLPVDG